MCAVYEEWLSEPLEFGTRKFVYVILWDTNLFALYTVIKKNARYMQVHAGRDVNFTRGCGYLRVPDEWGYGYEILPADMCMSIKFYP